MIGLVTEPHADVDSERWAVVVLRLKSENKAVAGCVLTEPRQFGVVPENIEVNSAQDDV